MTTAALSVTFPTLLDNIKRTDPNGSIAKIVEAMTPTNAILMDAVWKEGNLPTGHRVTTRNALPSVTWRRFNEGITGSKSTTQQVDEACGMLDGLSRVDVKLAALNGNAAAFRASEDLAFVSAMNKEMETGFFYHSTKSAPEKIMGLTPRMDSTSAAGGSQIVLCESGASGSDQSSIWLVGWGPNTVYGIYPKGSKAGIESKDKGEVILDDGSSSNKLINVYATYWTWSSGLCVEDWRYLVRIANIDNSAISATGDTIIPAMIKAVGQMKDLVNCRPVFYCNRFVRTYLWLQARNSVKNSTLNVENVEGKPVLSFMGIPVRMTDALTSTEAVVS